MENEKIRIQDDLYMHVNKEWLDNAVIPDDKPTAGGFSDLSTGVEELLISDFNKMAKGKLAVTDENMKKAVDLFALAKNTKKRNAEGLKPVAKTLEKIEKLAGISALNRKLKEFILENLPLPFEFAVDVDMKDSQHHCLMVAGPSTILPDVVYYREGMEQQKAALLGLWSQMANVLLSYAGLSEEQKAQYIADALKFDEIIAGLVKSREEWSEYTKMYNPMTVSKVAYALRPLKIRKVMSDFFDGKLPEKIIVADPRFLKGFKTLFNEENFELYKHWAYINTIISASGYLSEEIRLAGSMYQMALTGIKELPSIEKQAYRLAGGLFAEPVGLYYGRKYFGEEAKKDVVEMVQEIIETYKKRIKENGVLSPATQEKAILKLEKMVVKMGYPDKCDELYDKFTVSKRNSLYGAVKAIRKIISEDNISKLYKEVDRTKWVMPGHMVNACYNPTSNDITFPAAILQAPFYSIKQTRSENLGGIGAVIGHEISHAFDNNGAKCDENGNLNNWWTKEDSASFNKKTKQMVKQYDGIELPWGKVNGKLVVSENIADNGGMAVTLDIMSRMADADYEGYFKNWARVWCLKAREEYLKLILSIDVHSPSILRANITPRNFSEWYKTFGVTKADKMYIAPSKRIIIW